MNKDERLKETVFTFPCPRNGSTLSYCKELERRKGVHCTDPTSSGMKVEYDRIDTGDDMESFRYKYRLTNKHMGAKRWHDGPAPVACCGKMHEHFGDLVRFGGPYETDPNVGIHYVKWGDCEYHEPIDFCPFCGKPITCVEVGRFKQVTTKRTETREVTDTTEVPED